MITLLKTIRVGEEDSLAKAKKQLVNNALAAIIVFLVPTIVSVLVKVSFSNGEYKACSDSCMRCKEIFNIYSCKDCKHKGDK